MIDEKDNLQRQADRTVPKKTRSVVIYLVILFAAAIILLLLAFLMQQRNNETINSLRDSIASFESINDLVEENQSLREQLDELESEADDLQAQLDTATQLNEVLSGSYQETSEYLSALFTLYCAEIKAAEKEYADAAALLTDWGDFSDFISVLVRYDEETQESGADESILLYPRFEALVLTLADEGYFEVEQADGQLQISPVTTP